MKKLILTISLMFLTFNSFASVRNVQDNHKFVYQIIDDNGNHVSSETATLKIQKVSNSQWFDFNDSSFKGSGWTNKTTNLTEDATDEFYHYTFNPPAGETSSEQYLFVVDNASATYGDHQSELVSYQDFGSSDYDYSSDQVIVATNNDKTGYSLSASGIDNIWDEVQSGHSTAGTFGFYLDAQVSSAASPPSAATIADAVWDEALSGHATAGSAGKKLDDVPLSGTGDWTADEKSDIKEALSVDDGTVDTDLDDIESKTRRFR